MPSPYFDAGRGASLLEWTSRLVHNVNDEPAAGTADVLMTFNTEGNEALAYSFIMID